MMKPVGQLKQAWDDRQQKLGLTKRAVLFKRFPSWLNEAIHRRHMRFILRNIPQDTRHLLDVGCGYGRISREIKRLHPTMSFQGIDLCTEFSLAYERDIGPCFNVPIQDFQPHDRYDAIIVVTLLMYLDPGGHDYTLRRLWASLNPAGCLICIEPAIEILTLWRRVTGRKSASPTGGSVHHFSRPRLETLVSGLDDAVVQEASSICLVPFLSITALHHAVAVRKTWLSRNGPPEAGHEG